MILSLNEGVRKQAKSISKQAKELRALLDSEEICAEYDTNAVLIQMDKIQDELGALRDLVNREKERTYIEKLQGKGTSRKPEDAPVAPVRTEAVEKSEKTEKPGKAEKNKKTDKNDKPKKSDKAEKADKAKKADKVKSDKQEKACKSAKSDKSVKKEKTKKDGKAEKMKKSDNATKPEKKEKKKSSKKR